MTTIITEHECAWCQGLVTNSDSKLNGHPICDDCSEVLGDLGYLQTLDEEENRDLLHYEEPMSEEEYNELAQNIDSSHEYDPELGVGDEAEYEPEDQLPILSVEGAEFFYNSD